MIKRMPHTASPFNSPVEAGLRALVLLAADAPRSSDLMRLMIYDYLLVHSGDIPKGPASLHPATPYRSGELLVRRALIHDGLLLMISRELIVVNYGVHGIDYAASELTEPFLAYLESEYALKLQMRAAWVTSAFREHSNESLTTFALSHLRDWGGEFLSESIALWE